MKVPEGVTVAVSEGIVSVKGKQGENRLKIPPLVKVSVNSGEVSVEAPTKALKGTIESHINNMCKGVTEGYSHTLKLVFAHFPMSIEVKGKDILIKNFLGEKLPRSCKLVGETRVKADKTTVTISGPSKEDVGQTIANMKTATKIKKKDGRVFQDGIYPMVEAQ